VSVKSDLADVLIVGGGASGGIAAKHLAEAGLKVVVLEQGDWVNPSDLRQTVVSGPERPK
jgi:choline dehydrogenase-like flavoprotein